jgi:hypothetical protein
MLSRPPLQLVINNDPYTDRQAIASGQTIVGITSKIRG